MFWLLFSKRACIRSAPIFSMRFRLYVPLGWENSPNVIRKELSFRSEVERFATQGLIKVATSFPHCLLGEKCHLKLWNKNEQEKTQNKHFFKMIFLELTIFNTTVYVVYVLLYDGRRTILSSYRWRRNVLLFSYLFLCCYLVPVGWFKPLSCCLGESMLRMCIMS